MVIRYSAPVRCFAVLLCLPVPGFLAGVPYSVYVAEEIVRADLEAVGRKVYEVLYDIPKELPDGEGYWIKKKQKLLSDIQLL